MKIFLSSDDSGGWPKEMADVQEKNVTIEKLSGLIARNYGNLELNFFYDILGGKNSMDISKSVLKKRKDQ